MKRRAKDVGGMCADALIFYRRASFKLVGSQPWRLLVRQAMHPGSGASYSRLIRQHLVIGFSPRLLRHLKANFCAMVDNDVDSSLIYS